MVGIFDLYHVWALPTEPEPLFSIIILKPIQHEKMKMQNHWWQRVFYLTKIRDHVESKNGSP